MKSRKISEFRKLSIYGFQVTENSHNFYALLEFDITNLRNYLREKRAEGKEEKRKRKSKEKRREKSRQKEICKEKTC